ncbi:MAG: cytidine deaminase, partial [Bacteroidales bacterium]|nr:cytidine deaminase [Bacteroidales bacterium]
DVKIKSIAVSAKAINFKINHPVTPCGACRQVLAEYEDKQKSKIRIILKGDTGKIRIIKSVKDILPMIFHADELKK